MYYQFYDILWKNTRVFFLIMQTPPSQKKHMMNLFLIPRKSRNLPKYCLVFVRISTKLNSNNESLINTHILYRVSIVSNNKYYSTTN